MSPVVRDDLAKNMQTSVKEVISRWYDDNREILWLCPREHIFKGDGLIRRAVDHDGVTGHRFRIVIAGALDKTGGSAHEHEALCGVPSLGHPLGNTGLNKSAKGEAGKNDR